MTALKRTVVDSVNAVKLCQWQGNDFDCSRLFVNKPTDSGACFTFNPNTELLQAYKLANMDDDSGEWNWKTAYGTSINESKTFVTHNVGLKSGLSLVLLTNSSDYCASDQESAGFKIVIHDRSAEPLLQLSDDIRLSPGFITNIALSLRKTLRKTESYGFCKSSMNLRMYKGIVPYTNSDFFSQNCISEYILIHCGCLPFYSPRTITLHYDEFPEMAFKPDNLSLQIQVCGISGGKIELDCQIALERKLLRADSICYHLIPKPCKETNYQAQVSITKYPTSALLPSLNRRFGTKYTLDQFRLNFIFVNFFYHDYTFTTVTEEIKMTWIDLMNMIGGAAGMTLGVSIIGVTELLLWLVSRPILLVLKLRRQIARIRYLRRKYGFYP